MKLKIAGKKFGRLLVLEEHKERGKMEIFCGNVSVIVGKRLL